MRDRQIWGFHDVFVYIYLLCVILLENLNDVKESSRLGKLTSGTTPIRSAQRLLFLKIILIHPHNKLTSVQSKLINN